MGKIADELSDDKGISINTLQYLVESADFIANGWKLLKYSYVFLYYNKEFAAK